MYTIADFSMKQAKFIKDWLHHTPIHVNMYEVQLAYTFCHALLGTIYTLQHMSCPMQL